MFAVWIKIDETLPWVEIKGEYQTRSQAKREAEEILNGVGVKIVSISEKRKPMRALATART